MDEQGREQAVKESDEGMNASSKGLSRNFIPHLLNLYGSRATARDFEIYAPNATFEDPLMRANGVEQIKSAFYSLGKVFSESRIVEYTVQENVVGLGQARCNRNLNVYLRLILWILIDNKQQYKIFGKNVDVNSLIKLQVAGGKVVQHEDWWDKKPLENRNTVGFPLMGRALEISRRGSMLVTHLLMGFGKDPSP